MSMWKVCDETVARSVWTPSSVAQSAGTGMARAPGRRFGSALRAAQASLQAEALREEMKTLEQPAWRRLFLFHVYG
jgi:hypothetical protein